MVSLISDSHPRCGGGVKSIEQRTTNNHQVGGGNGLRSKVKVLFWWPDSYYMNYKIMVKEVKCSKLSKKRKLLSCAKASKASTDSQKKKKNPKRDRVREKML